MPVLSPCADVRSLIERHAGIKIADKGATVHGVREYHSNCPWCGGTDRFITRPETGWYTCSTRSSGCGRRGDMIDFLMDYASMSMREACEEIGLDPDEVEFCREAERVTYAQSLLMPPCKAWQERARAIIHSAKKCLWSLRGVGVLSYLRARGFTDETILRVDLGYIPAGVDGLWQKDSLETWGLSSEDVKSEQVTLYSGVLIPWYADGQIWKLEVRRMGNLKETDNKIPTIVGSRDTLYNLDTIQPGQPVVQVESALDALSGIQACGGQVPFVATGGVDKAKHECWVKRFEQSSCVLIAFDDDVPGDKGAVFWENALPNATRWTPWAHDINDMLIAGDDLQIWVDLGIEYHEAKEKARDLPVTRVSPSGDPPVSPVQDVPPVDHVEPGQADTPSAFSAVRICCRCAASPAGHASPGGDAYCAACYRCDRCGHAPQWVYDPAWKAQVCQCVMNAPHAATQIYPPYSPCALVALPRIQCPHTVLTFKDNHPCSTSCKGKTFEHGWCADHAYAHELLCLGAALGYPAVHGDYRHIEQGVENWEVYAECVSAQHAQDDMKQIRARYRLPQAA